MASLFCVGPNVDELLSAPVLSALLPATVPAVSTGGRQRKGGRRRHHRMAMSPTSISFWIFCAMTGFLRCLGAGQGSDVSLWSHPAPHECAQPEARGNPGARPSARHPAHHQHFSAGNLPPLAVTARDELHAQCCTQASPVAGRGPRLLSEQQWELVGSGLTSW